MKLKHFGFLSIVVVALLTSCGGNSYKNADFNYSIQLPSGFEAQNDDAAMEKSRGGKLFVHDGCMIDVNARTMDYAYITPEESVKQDYELATAVIDESSKILSKELNGTSYTVKREDSFGLRADYETQQNGVKVNIYITYDKSKQAEFDKEADEVIKSLKIEK